MRRYLLVALWPAGMAAIAAAAALAVRRAPANPVPAFHGDPEDPDATEPVVPAGELNGFGACPPETSHGDAGHGLAWPAGSGPDLPDWRPGLIQLAALSLAGGVLSYRVMEFIGRPVMKYGPKIDEPIERWTRDHQVRAWAEAAKRLNKIGSSWTTWAAAGTAGACLSASWRQQKWLPPAVLASAIAVDKATTFALRYRFRRLGPPGSPAGTYPAGGPDRVVLFTGLIANMLWREFSGSERGKVLALGAVGVLTFNMTYCREYLSKHWFTDIMSGVFYGAVLYTPFAVAIRAIAGPPVRSTAERRSQYPSLLVDHPQGVSASVAPVASVSR
ncbi:MAG: hypothetical protein ACRDNF_01015 [Streptosporangiaceae bacterium]